MKYAAAAVVALLLLAAAGPAAAAEGELRFGLHVDDLAFNWGVGPRVEEAAAGLIPGFSYAAPPEELRLKK